MYQNRGNAKKYPLPDSATSCNENNLAGTSRLPLLFLFPLEWLSAIPADYIDLPRRSDDSAAAEADIFDTAVNGFLTPALAGAFHRQAAGVDIVLAQGFSDPRLCLRGQRRYRPSVFVVLLNVQAMSLGGTGASSAMKKARTGCRSL